MILRDSFLPLPWGNSEDEVFHRGVHPGREGNSDVLFR